VGWDEGLALLRETGAEGIAHPGGTLLAHLRRVGGTLRGWGAAEDVVLAGLCHAAYGTDGFATALLRPDQRDRLVAAIGAPAEALVRRYGGCDRAATYPLLDRDPVPFTDRFDGSVQDVTGPEIRGFVAITVANELDLAREDPAFAARYGPGLRELFGRARRHLDAAGRADVQAVLG
jgi:hypothetical protein